MKAGLTVIAVISVLILGLGITAQTERWPFGARGGPIHFPSSWPKAHCLGLVETVNVVFWNEKPWDNTGNSVDFDPDNSFTAVDSQLLAAAEELVSEFWSGDTSYIVTSDRTKAIPNNARQISVVFKERALGRLETFAVLFSGRQSYGEYEANSDSVRLDGPSLKLNVDITPGERSEYVGSLKDLTTGRCDRPVSKYIIGNDETNWKFFPPYDERYRVWKRNQSRLPNPF